MGFPSTPILDTFVRADENPIVGWQPLQTASAARFRVVANQGAKDTSGASAFDYWPTQLESDEEAYATVTARPEDGSVVMLGVRANNPGNLTWDGYLIRVICTSTTDTWQFQKVTNHLLAPIGEPLVRTKFAVGDGIGISVTGQTLAAHLYHPPTEDACEGGQTQHDAGWVQILTAVDSTYAGAGYVCMATNGLNLRLKDFGGGSVVMANPLTALQPDADPYEEPAQYAFTTPVGGPIYETPEVISSSYGQGGIQATARTGVYDTDCDYRHSSKDDPLVYPGCRDCGSHCHDFFGNSSTDGLSTGATLLAQHLQDKQQGGRKHGCKDDGDGAAYWSPALYIDDVKRQPLGIHAYYRVYGTNPADIPKPYPVGFGMVSRRYEWSCGNKRFETKGPRIPPRCEEGESEGCCSAQAGFVCTVTFPDCWNGVDLYLPNSAHVKFRYPMGGKQVGPKCPPSHPVRIAELALVIRYGDMPLGDPVYRLSSGDETTMHADFFNAWEPDKQATLIQCCLDCERRNVWCQEDQHVLPPPHDCDCG